MAEVKESKGREKAKENTFLKLGTRPEDYEPASTLRICRKVDNCQLCGQSIGYDFLLQHKSNPEKNLYIGSDCIVKFCETYLPNMIQSTLRRLQLQMEQEIEDAKAEVFQKEYPTFSDDVSKLLNSLVEVLKKHEAYYEFRSNKNKLDLFDTIEEAKSDYRKKKYTTKPKVQQIHDAIQDLASGSFEERVIQHLADKKAKLPISEELAKSKGKPEIEEFYNNYFKYAKYINWDKNPSMNSISLSKMEKENFLCTRESYLDKRSRVKKKLAKVLPTVMEKLKETLLDHIKVQPIEAETQWGFYGDKEKLSQYKYFVSLSKDHYSSFYTIRGTIEDYGLAGIRELIYQKGDEKLAQLGADLNGYHVNNKFLFLTEDDAKAFEAAIFNLHQKKIEDLKSFMATAELTSEDMH